MQRRASCTHVYNSLIKDDQLCFIAVPHGMDDRFYLSKEAAQAYLEACVVQIVNNEISAEFGSRLLEPANAVHKEASSVESVVKIDQ